jgi:hypothetical protein
MILFPVPACPGSKPDITQSSATYLDDMLSINVQWQSPNPVLMVKVYAGSEPREVEIDEYDNRRNPHGYYGETTVVVNLEQGIERQFINYVIQLEDDLGQKSRQVVGKIQLTTTASAEEPAEEESYTEEPAEDTEEPESGDIVDKLISAVERHDAAPYMNKIKVTRIRENKVSFTSKATDDKGLKHVVFRILNDGGTDLHRHVISDLGTVWQGTTRTFTLAGGTYKVVAQAIDTSGNTSQEQRATFTTTGEGPLEPEPYETFSGSSGSASAEGGDAGSGEEITEYDEYDEYEDPDYSEEE